MDRDELFKTLRDLVPGKGSLEAALQQLRKLGIPDSELSEARSRYEAEVRSIRTLKIVRGLDDHGLPRPWYPGPTEKDVYWPAFRLSLEDSALDDDAIDEVDRSSSTILSRLPAPWTPDFSARGLIVGYVQSGKTTSFTALIAKAADQGYRLFIVLSGVTNNLRLQTQRRLNSQLIHPVETYWFKLTDEHDFRGPGNVNNLLSNDRHCLIAIAKKNGSRLRRLREWLSGAADIIAAKLPVLVIDDEADLASINVGSAEERSRINNLILDLLKMSRCAYVGYTATPFANLLIDPSYPSDLYPRDFIIDLERPDSYFGPERLFGREPLSHEEPDAAGDGMDVVRLVPEGELGDLRPPRSRDKRKAWRPQLTPSLRQAFSYFVLAATAKRLRCVRPAHSTMLLHTTELTLPQEQFLEPLRDLQSEMLTRIRQPDKVLIGELRTQWEDEQSRLRPDGGGSGKTPFHDLLDGLTATLGSLRLVLDNYRSAERLEYGDDPLTVLVVGGNTLSRGLTLEGLLVSYFVRSVNAYDTLLQMGRWFGYRAGYEDLPRIWMTAELQDWFVHLATVEREIRYDMERYRHEGLTPVEFAVRIRTHPKLNITAAAKMRAAVTAKMSFSGRRLQTILFNHKDAAWLAANIGAVKGLLRDAVAAGVTAKKLSAGRWLLGDVPVEAVVRGLESYRFHESAHDLKTDLLLGYIRDQNRQGELKRWNIVVMGLDKPGPLGVAELGLSEAVPLINRSRLNIDLPHANIKALMSKVDMVADLTLDPAAVKHRTEAQLLEMRPDDMGLLLVYPIGRGSRPMKNRSRVRAPLGAADDVIGIGLVFPEAKTDTPQEYMSADLSRIEQEEPEIETLTELDDKEEAADEGEVEAQ